MKSMFHQIVGLRLTQQMRLKNLFTWPEKYKIIKKKKKEKDEEQRKRLARSSNQN